MNLQAKKKILLKGLFEVLVNFREFIVQGKLAGGLKIIFPWKYPAESLNSQSPWGKYMQSSLQQKGLFPFTKLIKAD